MILWQTDKQTWTNVHGKINLSPYPEGVCVCVCVGGGGGGGGDKGWGGGSGKHIMS